MSSLARLFDASWQRCRVHWIRNALAHVSKSQHTVVAAAIRQAFDQPDRKHAGETWRHVANQLRSRWPKVVGRNMQRHRHQEFIRFLNAVEAEVPKAKAVRVILDNCAAHKHPNVR